MRSDPEHVKAFVRVVEPELDDAVVVVSSAIAISYAS
jgi:hypothetical protein